MGIVTTDDRHYKDIAAAIKKHVFLYPDGIKPKEMAGGVEEACFNANLNGYNEGYGKGYDEGFLFGTNTGRESERHNFWSAFQQNGKRSDYSYAFRTAGWSDYNFAPAYNINATVCTEMFRYSDISDLMGILNARGVALVVNSDMLYYFAYGSDIKEFPALGSSLTNMNYAFTACKQLQKIAMLDMSTEETCFCTNAFNNTSELVYIRFNSGIMPAGLNLQYATKLDRASFESNNEDGQGYGLIPALSDSVSGTVTVSAEAVAAAFPNRAEWEALCETKPSWTITEV